MPANSASRQVDDAMLLDGFESWQVLAPGCIVELLGSYDTGNDAVTGRLAGSLSPSGRGLRSGEAVGREARARARGHRGHRHRQTFMADGSGLLMRTIT